jgi:hypothetical protein
MPAWPCPHCRIGVLRLSPETFAHVETRPSKAAHSEEEWDPDWVTYTFSVWAKCSQTTCNEEVAIVGVGGLEPGWDPEGDMTWNEYFSPKYCVPMPDIISLPEKCPDEIARALRAAFSTFLAQPGAAANHIRIAVEHLLDHVGVERQTKEEGGEPRDLSLHRRIEAFMVVEHSVGAALMALKWVGNAGSHGAAIERNDLLSAFEILEHALEEIVNRRSAKVAELADRLAKRHGPRQREARPAPPRP